jgi:multidrug efflux pump subunit AcrA (membrane-fusion protein)
MLNLMRRGPAGKTAPGTELPARVRRLSVGGPLFAGYLIIVVFFFGGLGWAAVAPVTKGATVAGALITESKTKAVQHGKGGNIKKIHVIEGQKVDKDQLLVTLDDADIAETMRGIEGQIASARDELALVRKEHAVIADLVRRQLTPRPKLVEFERQIVQLERDIFTATSRLVVLDAERGRTAIRAPVSGRLLSLAVTGTGAVVAPGATIAEIVPLSDRLVVEGKLAANDIEGVHPGMRAKVWLSALNRRDAEPLKARLAWISPDSIEDKQSGQPQYRVRVVLKDSREVIEQRVRLHAGMRTEILIVKGTTTVLDSILDPVLRSIERSFRDH